MESYVPDLIKKAWRDTFYPQFLVGGKIINFFNGVIDPGFNSYFLKIPSAQSSVKSKWLYFLFLGIILYPLKNLIKSLVEFPLILFNLFLENLAPHYTSFPRLRLVILTSSVVFTLIRVLVTSILSPAFAKHKILETFHIDAAVDQSIIIDLINKFFRFMRKEFWDNLSMELNTKSSRIAKTALSFLAFLVEIHCLILFEESVSLDPSEQEKYLKFKQFESFDPNQTYCAISKKPLGFSKDRGESFDSTVMYYKERNETKYALLSELISHDPFLQHEVSSSLTRNSAVEALQKKYPLKKFEQVPTVLTKKLELDLDCAIELVSFEDLNLHTQAIARSMYGHYYISSAISDWLIKQNRCPLTRLPLNLGEVKKISLEVINKEISNNKEQLESNITHNPESKENSNFSKESIGLPFEAAEERVKVGCSSPVASPLFSPICSFSANRNSFFREANNNSINSSLEESPVSSSTKRNDQAHSACYNYSPT